MKNSSSEIRKKFINYFISKGHTYVDSSPVLPPNQDKTLLFTNAGMVQFKDIFLGLKDSKYKSAVTSQKCIRAGGKHNDLDNVGFTNRHHTFFEMLGNFSFGDYFKTEAIEFAWDFLINELKITPDKLWITVHDTDLEAKSIWLNNIGINKNQLSVISTSDNFWSMGDTGPCGPCTEIFYDYGDQYEGNPPGHGDEGERYVEIWNLVFMQFNRLSKDKIIDLPKPSVDTGMGLERICAVMQNEHSNYGTDLFAPTIEYIKKNIEKKFLAEHSSMKVIADHIRSISFLIMEGVIPSNEGQGYVLRRIIRRAIRHAQKINLKTQHLIDVIPIFTETLKEQYPELTKNEVIKQVLLLEVNKFKETLDTGLDILEKSIKKIISENSEKEISGELLFLLYDTYGFPVDLTETIAIEKKFKVDKSSFLELMKQQKINSKKTNKFDSDIFIDFKENYKIDFTGYESCNCNAKILDIYINGESTTKINTGQKGHLIINPCPFYAESGGQIGDSGIIFSKKGKFEVLDTQKQGGTNMLIGHLVDGSLEVDDKISAEVDEERRNNIKNNHSATHLLHASLIKHIGNEVQQRGSLVSDTKLRFDFSCQKPIKRNVLSKVESEVNSNIEKNIVSKTKFMPKDKAIEAGAVALFGEKYDDEVRVLSFGDVSVELCGGTHVNSTGEIGVFKILSESSISSGIRRIEAITGMSANNYLTKRDDLVTDICHVLNVQDDELKSKISALLEDNKKLKKYNSSLLKDLNYLKIIEIVSNKNLILDYNVHTILHEYLDGKILKNILEDLKNNQKKLVLTIIQKNKGKVEIYSLVSKDCFEFFTAKEIINMLNKTIGSTGGGRDDIAQAGVDAENDLNSLHEKIKINIEKMITNEGN